MQIRPRPRLKQAIHQAVSPPSLEPIKKEFPHAPDIFDTARFIEDVRLRGGLGAVERAQKYGRTDNGRELEFPRWWAQSLRLIADWRVAYVAVTGAAQTGKTLSSILAFTDATIHGRLNYGYAYAGANARDKYQKQQFRPVLTHWCRAVYAATGIDINSPSDTKDISLYQIGGASGNFAFASTSKQTASNEGKALIAGPGASYPADIQGNDEKSRWPSGVSFSARLGKSCFASKPMRDIGTRGGGEGIERDMQGLKHEFIPHYKCRDPACAGHSWAPLDPCGCLITPVGYTDAYGRQKEGYFSDDGRPMDWWHTDPLDKVGSAIFCCQFCGIPITEAQRTTEADMICRITGIRLETYLDQFPQDFSQRDRVGLDMCALARSNSENLAVDLIEGGLKADDPRTWQQEDLGIVSVGRTNRITNEVLFPLIGAKVAKATEEHYRTYAGCDYGRGGVWLWIMRVWPRADWRGLRNKEIRDTSVREILFGGGCHRNEVEEICDRYGVDFGLIDNEPDTSWSGQLCESSRWDMFDQVQILDEYKPGTVQTGGDEFDCWKINNAFFHWEVIKQCVGSDVFDSKPSYRFPPEWEQWRNLRTEQSPLRHLKGPYFDPIAGKWNRGPGNIDDIFMAALAAEAAFAIDLGESITARSGDIDW
jgi:hypothetical protein